MKELNHLNSTKYILLPNMKNNIARILISIFCCCTVSFARTEIKVVSFTDTQETIDPFLSRDFCILHHKNNAQYKITKDGLELKLGPNSRVIASKKITPLNVSAVKVWWKIKRFPSGPDWEKGGRKKRDPLAIGISFGGQIQETCSPDLWHLLLKLFIVPPQTLFFFHSHKEPDKKLYVGNYYTKEWKYFSRNVLNLSDVDILDTFNVSEYYKKAFKTSYTPPINALTIEGDLDNIGDSSIASIKEISFLIDD